MRSLMGLLHTCHQCKEEGFLSVLPHYRGPGGRGQGRRTRQRTVGKLIRKVKSITDGGRGVTWTGTGLRMKVLLGESLKLGQLSTRRRRDWDRQQLAEIKTLPFSVTKERGCRVTTSMGVGGGETVQSMWWLSKLLIPAATAFGQVPRHHLCMWAALEAAVLI